MDQEHLTILRELQEQVNVLTKRLGSVEGMAGGQKIEQARLPRVGPADDGDS